MSRLFTAEDVHNEAYQQFSAAGIPWAHIMLSHATSEGSFLQIRCALLGQVTRDSGLRQIITGTPAVGAPPAFFLISLRWSQPSAQRWQPTVAVCSALLCVSSPCCTVFFAATHLERGMAARMTRMITALLLSQSEERLLTAKFVTPCVVKSDNEMVVAAPLCKVDNNRFLVAVIEHCARRRPLHLSFHYNVAHAAQVDELFKPGTIATDGDETWRWFDGFKRIEMEKRICYPVDSTDPAPLWITQYCATKYWAHALCVLPEPQPGVLAVSHLVLCTKDDSPRGSASVPWEEHWCGWAWLQWALAPRTTPLQSIDVVHAVLGDAPLLTPPTTLIPRGALRVNIHFEKKQSVLLHADLHAVLRDHLAANTLVISDEAHRGAWDRYLQVTTVPPSCLFLFYQCLPRSKTLIIR